MISKLDFVHYRRLIGVSILFFSTVNSIAGTNGTCKSSILDIFGNSFQSFPCEGPFLNNLDFIKVPQATHVCLKPKIESLRPNL